MPETTDSPSFSRSLPAILLPICATISCMLCLPILINHIKHRNLAPSVVVFCIVLENLFNLINPLIWPTNDFEHWWNGIGFCDVESKLRLATYIGYIGALACIYRQLALILDTDHVILLPSPAQRRRRIIIEASLCFGFPVYIMGAHYIVQSGRYYVFAITGCVPIVDSSWPSLLLVLIWPGVMWVVAAIYCAIIIHRLIKYRRHVSSILSRPQCQYNQSQFVRLFAMATILILIFLPIALFVLVQNFLSYRSEYRPFAWNRIHDWTDSIFFAPSNSGENFGRWAEVVNAFVVFLSFAFGRDGLQTHRRILLNLGLGKIFPALKLPRDQEARLGLHHSEQSSLLAIFRSISSRARLIFYRRPYNGSSSPYVQDFSQSDDVYFNVPNSLNTSSSVVESGLSSKADIENGPSTGFNRLYPGASPDDQINPTVC